MNTERPLACPRCGATALADDEFCEQCGTPVGLHRDAAREHMEVDVGCAAGVSDRGLVHRRNEDSFFVASQAPAAVAVVCDGVSVSAAPQVASAVAADVVGRVLLDALSAGEVEDWRGVFASALAAGDQAVRDVAWLPSTDRDPPSCTVVAAVWDGSKGTVGWAGDSRAYWVASDDARQLTQDHSSAQEQVSAGTLSQAAAEADGRAHVITRWLGPDAPAVEPAIVELSTGASGWLVLCSDGLWNHVPTTSELTELVNVSPGNESPLALARALTARALARGGHDNITVAVIDVEGS